jgi:hypothetical protein
MKPEPALLVENRNDSIVKKDRQINGGTMTKTFRHRR